MSSVTPFERKTASSEHEVARLAAERLAVALKRRRGSRPPASLVLAGGSTPRPLYELLATNEWRHRVHWNRVEIFFGDERCVPPDDPRSNYRMAKERLLDPLGLREDQVHRIEVERGAIEAAQRYEQTIIDVLGPQPHFDCVLLGVGEDGHTASIFPGEHALRSSGLVAAAHSPRPPHDRVTLTVSALNAARQIIFLVAGAGKAEIVQRLLGRRPDADHPAAQIRPADGSVLWVLDTAAAAMLE